MIQGLVFQGEGIMSVKGLGQVGEGKFIRELREVRVVSKLVREERGESRGYRDSERRGGVRRILRVRWRGLLVFKGVVRGQGRRQEFGGCQGRDSFESFRVREGVGKRGDSNIQWLFRGGGFRKGGEKERGVGVGIRWCVVRRVLGVGFWEQGRISGEGQEQVWGIVGRGRGVWFGGVGFFRGRGIGVLLRFCFLEVGLDQWKFRFFVLGN